MSKVRGLVLDPREFRGVSTPPDSLKDESRYGNDGVHTDITWVRLPSGVWARGFNGSTSVINLGDRASLTFTSGPFSFFCWFRTSNVAPVGKWYYFFDKGLEGVDGWSFNLSSAGGTEHSLLLNTSGPGWQQSRSNPVVSQNNRLYQIGFTRDGPAPLFYVNGVDVTILVTRELYFNKEGKPITVSLKDYTQQIIKGQYATLEDFLSKWNSSEQKIAIIKGLEEQGVLVQELLDAVNKELDLFDLICHVAFEQPPMTRKERANNVKKRNYYTKYGEQSSFDME